MYPAGGMRKKDPYIMRILLRSPVLTLRTTMRTQPYMINRDAKSRPIRPTIARLEKVPCMVSDAKAQLTKFKAQNSQLVINIRSRPTR